MMRALRLIAFALLVAALPVRGYAAGAMLFCGGAHGMAASPTAQHPDAHASAHDAHASHDAAAAHASHADPAAADASDPGGCGVCGDCCAGVAGSPVLPTVTAMAPSNGPIPFAPPLYRGADLVHAERPPLG